MTKENLRKQFLEQRKNLSPTLLQEKSQAISQNFFNYFELHSVKKLHIFFPIIRQNEINTWFIINEIRANYPSVTLIISKSDFQTCRMESYVFDTDTLLIENRWGILEPVNAAKCPNNMIDMILMPLLCFDKQGFRVGYGKGFYDRFLSKCKTEIIKVGLSLFEPVDKIADANEYDVKMDFCVMCKKVWS